MTRTQAERQAIERDGATCLRCGRNLHGIPASVHHRLPRSAGTKAQIDRVENLTVVCGDGSQDMCHHQIHNNPRQSYDQGWLVRRGTDPAGKPLITLNQTMIMLLPDGTKIIDSLAGAYDDVPF